MPIVAHLLAGFALTYAAFLLAVVVGGGWPEATEGGSDPVGGAFYILGMSLSVCAVALLIAAGLWILARGRFVPRWWVGIVMSSAFFLPVIYRTV